MQDAWIMVFVILYAIAVGSFLMELRTVVRMYFKDEYKDIRYLLKGDIIRLLTLIIVALFCAIALAISILI